MLNSHVAVLLSLAVISATVATQAQTASPPLAPFDFAKVDFGFDCAPSPEFDRLASIFRGGSVSDPTMPDEALFNAVSGNITQELRLDAAIEWHGLKLAGIRVFHGVERGPANRTLLFANDSATVRHVWATRGNPLPETQETRPVEGMAVVDGALGVVDEVVDGALGVVDEGEFTAVTCYSD